VGSIYGFEGIEGGVFLGKYNCMSGHACVFPGIQPLYPLKSIDEYY
jgi:hypothetical protein